MKRYNVGYYTGLASGWWGAYTLLGEQEPMWLLLLLGTFVICTIGRLIARSIKE